MTEDDSNAGYCAFEYITRNLMSHGLHDAIVARQMRQPHSSFPVSAKSGIDFTKEID